MFKRLLSALAGNKASAPEEWITVHDAYGREVRITRTEWRDKMFLPNLQQHWDDADVLYGLIIAGHNDGFAAELLPAATRLLEIDPLPERSHTILGIVQMDNGQLDAAEATLRAGMARVGETSILLTNLSKVFHDRGDHAQSEQTLWQAVLADPNQDSGLMGWLAIQQERGGDAAWLSSLQTVAALPGSWRAQLWLARHYLEQDDFAAARALYATVLDGGRYDGNALTMMSGDMGNHGQVALIFELIGPVYDEHQHDPMTGLNLLRACEALGQAGQGEALLSRMYALGIAPLKQHLDQFAQTFQALRADTATGTPIDPDNLQVSTLALSQPVWHYGLRDAGWLFVEKAQDAPRVGFFALSKITDGTEAAASQREDDLGRFTRAIPLYLAESAHYWTDYHTSSYFQVVEGGGPVVAGTPADSKLLFDLVPDAMRYFVTGEIGCSGAGVDAEWRLALTVWDCSTRSMLASESGVANRAELGALVQQLEVRVLAHVGLPRAKPLDAFYTRPAAAAMAPYLDQLGQAFMLMLVAMGAMPTSAMWGERAMLDWPLTMALASPTEQVPAIMYLSGLGKALDYRSEVLPEYKERTLQLLQDASAVNGAAARLTPLAWRAFGMRREFDAHLRQQSADADTAYVQWLERVDS